VSCVVCREGRRGWEVLAGLGLAKLRAAAGHFLILEAVISIHESKLVY
jgi:hypothetical protein